MTIKWYPGHMAKARRQIVEGLARIDVVVEVLDARLPASSANPLLDELRHGKPCIKVLNKNDLADPLVTEAWIRYFEDHSGVRALPLDATQHAEARQIPRLCRQMVPHRGKPGKTLRAMVVGIPNVGKSTLINTLAGKKMARVGDRPAITTSPQQIDLRNGIHLNDTPGLLWPVLSDQKGAYRLAASGAIGDSAIDFVDVAMFAAEFLMQRYPERLGERYRFAVLPDSPAQVLDDIGRRRGCLASGGEVDLYRAAEILLRELRAVKLGRISLEDPDRDFDEPVAATDQDA